MIKRAEKRRVRPVLLVLLWIWAVCVFAVVDLFFNVEEFGGIRPRARLYRAMRYTGHRLVGEPYLDGDFGDALPPLHTRGAEAEALREALAEVRALEREGSAEGLRASAIDSEDARVRIEALSALVRVFGPRARRTLVRVALNRRETVKVRSRAARLLGGTGPAALSELEDLLAVDLPRAVRRGAVRGLGQLGSRAAAERLVSLADDPSLNQAALLALAEVAQIEAFPFLADPVTDTSRGSGVRAGACRALAAYRTAGSVDRLIAVLGGDAPEDVRAVAAWGLGLMGDRRAIDKLEAARYDACPAVGRAARSSLTRLRRSS